MDSEVKQELHAAILAATNVAGEQHSLSCAEAHRIADEHGAERRLVGEICNQQGIRIVTCQLGLFK